MTKGSALLVAALENEGVDRIFGIPGEENLDLVESLRTSKIELVLTRHEQAAAFMAATQGRLTGEPGVCLSTLGPGALNFTTGAAYAHLGAMPMVMVVDHYDFLCFVLERNLSGRMRSPSMKTSTSRRTLVCQPG
jgi:acetolactate synthase I/II/III large subunit